MQFVLTLVFGALCLSRGIVLPYAGAGIFVLVNVGHSASFTVPQTTNRRR